MSVDGARPAGLPGQGSRFIDAKVEWRAGTYIPAYVRGYPFIALRPNEKATSVLALDPSADDFKARGGQPLIGADGQPLEQLKSVAAFQGEYRQLTERTQVMTLALNEAGVLQEGTLQVQVLGGEAQTIGGFLVVSETRLRALKGDALQKLMEADALGLAYAQLFSLGNLGNLLAAGGEAVTDTSAEKPKTKRRGK